MVLGLVFVLDVCDRDRLYEAREELRYILNEEILSDVPIIVLANKVRLPIFIF